MGHLIGRRILGAAATFILSTLVVFGAAFALPGDPARVIAGRRTVPEATLRAIRIKYHLDETLPQQYLRWLGGLLRGDFGQSYASRRPVTDILVEALPVTAKLLGLTLVVELTGGAVLGVLAAGRRGGRFDSGVLASCVIGLAVPAFVLGAVVQDVFGVRWRILPVAGTSSTFAYVLPACTLAVTGYAVAARVMRSQAMTHRSEPHVVVARAKGVSEGAITRRHVVRNALIPFVTFVGLEIGTLAGGSIVTERIFNLPGVGRVVARAISQRDNALIIGFTMAVIAVYLVVDLLADLVAVVLDPRLRVQ
ncbi:MAG: ABC-type dipeptide/oligopeptide/nickel transport system, permease component [Ilumatobacteraceae bacterium]|nr:ABC-type dipeptide/oligopeptide/nickel transport system, permease component [Ilumatobacteraceae bacterium]